MMLTPAAVRAQAATESASPTQVSATDYARAEALIGWNARELVIDDAVNPKWMSAHSFWYRNHSAKGYEFLVVDAATGAKRQLFDPVKLASVLSERADTAYDPAKLPFRDLKLLRGGQAIQFDVGKKHFWTCDIVAYTCTGPDSVPAMKASEVKSPDGKWIAYERGGNLYLRGTDGGAETALTTDGTPDYGYGLASIGCCQQVTNVRNKTELRPYVLWSPDSRRLITHKWDQRNVRQMHLLEVKNPAPFALLAIRSLSTYGETWRGTATTA